MKHLFCLLALMAALHVDAQSPSSAIIQQSTALIMQAQYEAADLWLDSILKKDGKNVDALMMKGNVVLNKSLSELPVYDPIRPADESIFDNKPKDAGQSPRIVPAEVVKTVANYWNRCLKLDPSRKDIRMGLCSVYAMALMKPELKKAIHELLLISDRSDPELPFRIAEYARKFKERGRFDEAIEVYRFIAGEFKGVSGLWGDIAAECFYEGRMKEALAYLDTTMKMQELDETTYLNSAFIYSELGYFDNAYQCLQGYSQKFGAKMDLFYRGLMKFAESDASYDGELKLFLQQVDSNAYYPEYILAGKLLAFRDSFSISDFQSLVDSDVAEWYKSLICTRAMRQFKGNCEPFLVFGIFQSSIRNYQVANAYLEEGTGCKMQPYQTEYWKINYAYSLYQSGSVDSAMGLFKELLDSKNSFRQQAAQYFTANYYANHSQPNTARSLYQQILDARSGTKYRELAKRRMEELH